MDAVMVKWTESDEKKAEEILEEAKLKEAAEEDVQSLMEKLSEESESKAELEKAIAANAEALKKAQENAHAEGAKAAE